jgi:hypothetical protein
MSVSNPATLVVGLLLIGFGLVFPMVTLLRMNRLLSQEHMVGRYLVATLVIYALLPLSAVLTGFYVLSARAQDSPLFLGALMGTLVLLVISVLVRRLLRSRP